MTLHTDNRGEFTSRTFTRYLHKHGITHQLSTPYSHPQNGRAERIICTIKGQVLSMASAVNALSNLWGKAALMCAHVFMFTPTQVLPNNSSLYKIITGHHPDVSHLRIWGTHCFARVPLELQMKLGLKSQECKFMGYPAGVKGYHVRDNNKRTFFNLCNIIFNESCANTWGTAPDPISPQASPNITPIHINMSPLPPAPQIKPASVNSTLPLCVPSSCTRIPTAAGILHANKVEKSKIRREKLAAGCSNHATLSQVVLMQVPWTAKTSLRPSHRLVTSSMMTMPISFALNQLFFLSEVTDLRTLIVSPMTSKSLLRTILKLLSTQISPFEKAPSSKNSPLYTT
jgi:hypothetical protein